MKIAVVGAGVAGLTTAHLLSRRHEVHVFEADGRPGGHTHTVEVDGTPVDTGFIVFNDWTYPNFIKLMAKLGVASQLSDMSFSVKAEPTGWEYNGTSLNALFAQRLNLLRPSFLGMVRDILRFNRQAAADADTLEPTVTLQDYLARGGYGQVFIDHYIVPMGAAIWSSPAEKMAEFPAAFFFRFFKNHGMLSVEARPVWRTLRGGSRAYLGPLTAPFRDRVHLNDPVKRIHRHENAVAVSTEKGEAFFDQVVLACHSDQALRLLADPFPAEREVLGAIPYQENSTVLHTDAAVMPRRPLAWASWNYLVPRESRARVAVTYWMNKLQALAGPRQYFVSLNMEDRISPDKILRRFTYHHPVFTRAGVAAQARWGEISGKNRTHYCGAYWRNGFHEDGVVSGLRVAEAFGEAL